jgi:uncharacterized protein YdhG (YjbR/CyaY superfamily)
MAKASFKSVDEYIATHPDAVQAILRRVRRTIRRVLPGAEEVISYQIPAYRLPVGAVLYFAGWKAHYSLYPATSGVVAALGDALAPYEVSKGTIRFPLSQPVPVRLIERIARVRAKEAALRAKAKTAGLKKRGRATGMTAERFRRLALALPEATEVGHMGHPDFRVGGKVFATLGYPDDGWGMVKLTPDQQEALVSAEPSVYVAVRGGWGRRGATNVRLRAAKAASLRVALATAWRNVAPRALATRVSVR